VYELKPIQNVLFGVTIASLYRCLSEVSMVSHSFVFSEIMLVLEYCNIDVYIGY